MQEKQNHRSNKDRTVATRAALTSAARKLFTEKGYAETGTPEIVRAAKVTRGALYHHFTDKADLFKNVLEIEAQTIATEIQKKSSGSGTAIDQLLAGADAYFAAMTEPGRVRLLLLDGPAVLGHSEMGHIDTKTGAAELQQGLTDAISTNAISSPTMDALTELVSAAFDRASLAIAAGGKAELYKEAISLILKGLADTAE